MSKSISSLRRAFGSSGKRLSNLNQSADVRESLQDEPDYPRYLNKRGSENSLNDNDSTDELYSDRHGNSSRAISITVPPMYQRGGSKSSSLGSSNGDIRLLVDQDDILSLTLDVRAFSDALARLKGIFDYQDIVENPRIAAHERLGEVLSILRSILQKYPALHATSTDIFTSAGTLISRIKGLNYEEKECSTSEFYNAIDSLALAFSSSVSEYLMGDVDASSLSLSSKTRSFENLTSPGQSLTESISTPSEMGQDRFSMSKVYPCSAEADEILLKMESGIELALDRAKAWSKYSKDVINYIEKRMAIEVEYSKNLSKLALTSKPIIAEESYLVFQSAYCTALEQDLDRANTNLATCQVIMTHKFIEPLNARRIEHDKIRKNIKDAWTRELKRMQDAVANLRKSKTLYVQRQHEYEKAKDVSLRLETDTLGSSAGLGGAKLDKKKRLQEDAMHKAAEAETTYKACVVEANTRQQELAKIKEELLTQIRDSVYQCDQTMKAVTVSYFQFQHTMSAAAPVQYQTLCESCRSYEPGAQFSDYVKHLPVVGQTQQPPELYVFEPYTADTRFSESRKRSSNSNFFSELETSTGGKSERVQKQATHSSDTESNSSKSHDSSPSASPCSHARKMALTAEDFDEDRNDTRNLTNSLTLSGKHHRSLHGKTMSNVAETHDFRKLRTPSKCRECESYVFYQGAECAKCGLSCHKKCLEVLHIPCGTSRLTDRRLTTFGVDFDSHLQQTRSEIPYIVSRCVAEIDERGLTTKGIYRISGVKSKVEKLCESFETGSEIGDLSEHHPAVISNVLKLYLRQLPQPLTTIDLYSDFIQVAKEDMVEGREEVACIQNLKSLIKQLPKHNRQTLAVVMHHLKRVTEQVEINQMCAVNLGIVFGPTLLRPSMGPASLNALMDTQYQSHIIEMLIVNVDEIFGPPVKIPSDTDYRAMQQGDSDKHVDHHSSSSSSRTERSSSSSSSTISSLVRQVSIPGISSQPPDNSGDKPISTKSQVKASKSLSTSSNKKDTDSDNTKHKTDSQQSLSRPGSTDCLSVNNELRSQGAKATPTIKPALLEKLSSRATLSPTKNRPVVPTKPSRQSSVGTIIERPESPPEQTPRSQSLQPQSETSSVPGTDIPVTNLDVVDSPGTNRGDSPKKREPRFV